MTLLTTLGVQLLVLGAAAAPPAAASAAAAPVATAAVTLTATAGAASPSAGEKPHCESSRPQYGDTMQVECALRASDAPRKFKFEVRFTGGHDDTMASLSATLNGKPLACDEGSKTELMGEFGEISIHCQFSSEDAQQLKVSVQWHHAQYSDFLLDVL